MWFSCQMAFRPCTEHAARSVAMWARCTLLHVLHAWVCNAREHSCEAHLSKPVLMLRWPLERRCFDTSPRSRCFENYNYIWFGLKFLKFMYVFKWSAYWSAAQICRTHVLELDNFSTLTCLLVHAKSQIIEKPLAGAVHLPEKAFAKAVHVKAANWQETYILTTHENWAPFRLKNHG
jgi:hypothetical protein